MSLKYSTSFFASDFNNNESEVATPAQQIKEISLESRAVTQISRDVSCPHLILIYIE